MKKTKAMIGTTAIAAGAIALSVAGVGNVAAATVLKGNVSDPGSITIKKGTANVTSVKAGSYTIQVKDTSAVHNFRLKGPGVNKATTVKGKSSPTWNVTLKKGTYTIQCDPHIPGMKKTFRVT